MQSYIEIEGYSIQQNEKATDSRPTSVSSQAKVIRQEAQI